LILDRIECVSAEKNDGYRSRRCFLAGVNCRHHLRIERDFWSAGVNNSSNPYFAGKQTLSLENKVAVWPIRGAAMVNSVEENVSVVGSNISAVPATSPPAMSTVPSLSRVAVCAHARRHRGREHSKSRARVCGSKSRRNLATQSHLYHRR